MLIGFFKGQPTEYIIKYVRGREVKKGAGLAFYYFKHNTQIVAIPTISMDTNFIFNESTGNFQAVTIQGQFTYRISNPQQAATLLNFTFNPERKAYASNDPERIPQRLTNIIQMETRSEIEQRSLEDALRQSEEIATAVLKRVREGGLLEPMGLELLSVYFLAIRPTPEVGKALEADYRESLLRKADEAIYARRAAAVEQERTIKENELRNEIALEEQRHQLIDLQGSNAKEEAEHRGQVLDLDSSYRAKAIGRELEPYRNIEPRVILALGLKELGQNASKLGNLTITSEILSTLLNGHKNS